MNANKKVSHHQLRQLTRQTHPATGRQSQKHYQGSRRTQRSQIHETENKQILNIDCPGQ